MKILNSSPSHLEYETLEKKKQVWRKLFIKRIQYKWKKESRFSRLAYEDMVQKKQMDFEEEIN